MDTTLVNVIAITACVAGSVVAVLALAFGRRVRCRTGELELRVEDESGKCVDVEADVSSKNPDVLRKLVRKMRQAAETTTAE